MYRKGAFWTKGQSVVETALVLPIVIILLMGIVDFGLLFNNYLVVSNASREGARNAAVGFNDGQIRDVVTGASSTLDLSDLNIDIYPSESQRKKGEDVTVTVEYDNSLFTPIISSIVPNPVHLRVKTVMRVE